MDKVIRCGQVSNKGSQAGTVYNINGIFPTICACTHGYAIGNIMQEDEIKKNKNNNYDIKGEYVLRVNKKQKVVSLFSGIGAFESALSKFGDFYDLVMMAEIDIYASLSYAGVHKAKWQDVELKSEEEMREYLISRNIGKDFKTGKNPVSRMKGKKLEQLYQCAIATKNQGDVSLVDFKSYKNQDIDLVVGGSPCQDFSIAGKQQGSIWVCKECGHEYNPLEQHYSKRDRCPKCNSSNLNKTRSSLLVEYLRAIRELRPKYFVYENVKNIKGKEFIKIFKLFEEELKEYGYNTYNQVLNSKDYEVPQNRERVFVVGIREEIIQEYNFPEKMPLKLRLKDILEDEVDDKYYLSEEVQDRFKITSQFADAVENKSMLDVSQVKRENKPRVYKECSCTLNARDYKDPRLVLHKLYSTEIIKDCDIPQEILNDNERQRRVYNINGISPTVLSRSDGAKTNEVNDGAIRGRYNSDGKVEQKLELRNDGITNTITTVEKDNVIIENNEPKIDMLGLLDIKGNEQVRRVYGDNGLAPTLNTMQGGNRQPKVLGNKTTEYRIRKLTPKECWRLMGFSDEEFNEAKEMGVSESQLYKQAGNSIVVNVLYYIFKNLFIHNENKN